MSDTLVDVTDNELCVLDGKGRQWHRENPVNHVFTTEEGDLRAKTAEKPTTKVKPQAAKVTPSDPILRFILIEKGLISPEELSEAETKFHALGALVTSPQQ